MSAPSRRQAIVLARAKAAAQARQDAEDRRIRYLAARGIHAAEVYLRAEATR